ncbi:hypothetical protein GW930_00215 [Candidatus Saccharibacteria bacterium]|nr:hypothetical protein [Candidatus Saccharibacteria bacterium]
MISNDLIYETLLSIQNTLAEMQKSHTVLKARVEGHEIVILETSEEVADHAESIRRHSRILTMAGLK